MIKDNFFDMYVSNNKDSVIVMFHLEKTSEHLKKDLKLNNTNLKKKYDDNWEDPFDFNNNIKESLPLSKFLNEESNDNIGNTILGIDKKEDKTLEEDIFLQFSFKKINFYPTLICKYAIALSSKDKVDKLKKVFQKVNVNIDECSTISEELEFSIKEVINSVVFKKLLNKISIESGNGEISNLDIHLISEDDIEDIRELFDFYLKNIDVVSESFYLKRQMQQDNENIRKETENVVNKPKRKVLKF